MEMPDFGGMAKAIVAGVTALATGVIGAPEAAKAAESGSGSAWLILGIVGGLLSYISTYMTKNKGYVKVDAAQGVPNYQPPQHDSHGYQGPPPA